VSATERYFGQFPCRLRDLMSETSTTQQVLADHVGVKRQTISTYMSGEGEPPISKAQKIAEYFGVSLDYLVGKDKCKTPDNEQIHNLLGLTDDAIKGLRLLNNPPVLLRVIAEPVRRALNMLLTFNGEGFRILRYIDTYINGHFMEPSFLVENDDDSSDEEYKIQYSDHIFVKSDIDSVIVPPEALSESVLYQVITHLRRLKEGRERVNPENPE